MNDIGKQLSNPYSTGGGGVHFENRVQASFVVLMLAGGYSPCLPSWPISEIKLQGKYHQFNTDDVIIYANQPEKKRQAKLLGQIKHSIKMTKGDKTFGEVIQAAWSDFNNDKVFSEQTDALALITGPLSATDTDHVRALLKQAEYSKDADDFMQRVMLGKFTNTKQREKLEVFKHHLKIANGDLELTDSQVWRFMRHYHLLIYDLDIKGVTLSLLHSLIGQYSNDRAEDLLALIEQEVTYRSENAGTITLETIPENIIAAFREPTKRTIPTSLVYVPALEDNSDWNLHQYASELAIANLLGAWSEKYDADMAAVAQLAREDFSEWIFKIREVLQQSDSPVMLKNGVWGINKREELWQVLAPRIFDDMLELFKQCAITVLTERDPKFELSTDKRFASSIYGKTLKHSQSLRKGLAESLALLASHSNKLENCSLTKPQRIASEVVHTIFKDSDAMLWGSLTNLLPLLAEAAPEEFMTAIETAMEQSPCPFDELFVQEDSGIITGENYLSGLLWALETLAWDEQYLVRVTVVLGELAARDPGGKWANRPSNSLTTIFLPWLPQTTASITKRKVAVQTMSREVPEVGWKLLLNLLPNQATTSSGSHKPKWRKAIQEEWAKEVPANEYWEQVTNYSDMAVDMAMRDMEKLMALVGELDHLPPSSFDKVLEHISSEEISTKPENELLDLWTELTMLAIRHRRFFDAKWALKSEMIAKIEEVAGRIAPINPLNRYRLLYSNRDADLYEEKGNWEEQRQQLDKQRQKAIKEIFNYGGITSILELANMVESPHSVGYSLGSVDELEIESALLPDLLVTDDQNQVQVVSGFIWGRYISQGWRWVDNIDMTDWGSEQIGKFLTWLPFDDGTWQRVKVLLGNSDAEYWSRVNVNPYQTRDGLESAIDNLIKHGRPYSAIQCLNRALHTDGPLIKTQIVKALSDAISSEESPAWMSTHDIVELIKELQGDPNTNPKDLFHIEWAYLPLLDRYNRAAPKLLHERLSSDPDFFCEVIRLVYRSKNEVKPEKEPTEAQKNIAENAYRLLQNWRTPPGTQSDGRIMRDNLMNWLETTKKICTETGHLEVALLQVGNVLYYSPPDPEGLWIDQAVAEALNAKDVKKLRDGYRLQVFNSRGAHWVDPTGKPERELAEEYRNRADEVENSGFQRFAVTLRSIADSYYLEAEQIIAEHRQGEDEIF